MYINIDSFVHRLLYLGHIFLNDDYANEQAEQAEIQRKREEKEKEKKRKIEQVITVELIIETK
jgi:hypothetical protein